MTKFSHADFSDILKAPGSFPSTAGTPIPPDELESLRENCLAAADQAGNSNSNFDVLVGYEFYHFGKDHVGDLGNPQVWDFFTLILLPDVAAQRFDPRSTTPTRFTGGNRRHVFQRLWRRWLVLGPELNTGQKLKEDDFVALLERRITSEKPILSQTVAHKIINSGYAGDDRRDYSRTLIKRLQQISGVVHLEESDAENLAAVLEEVDAKTREGLESHR